MNGSNLHKLKYIASIVIMGDNSNCTLCEKYLTIKGIKSSCCDFCDKLVCILCQNISTKLFNAMNEAIVDTSALLVACQKCNKQNSEP